MTRRGYALHLINDVIYGQIVNMRNVTTDMAHPELFDLWEERYILQIVRDSETNCPEDLPKISPADTVIPG